MIFTRTVAAVAAAVVLSVTTAGGAQAGAPIRLSTATGTAQPSPGSEPGGLIPGTPRVVFCALCWPVI